MLPSDRGLMPVEAAFHDMFLLNAPAGPKNIPFSLSAYTEMWEAASPSSHTQFNVSTHKDFTGVGDWA